MTKMYVQEYAGLAATAQGDSVAVPAEPPLASYVVDYTAGVANGPVYQAGTKFITVENDSIASVTFNGTPAAVTDKRLPAAPPAPLLVGVGSLPNGRASAITNT